MPTKDEAPRQAVVAEEVEAVIELYPGQNLEHAIEDLAGWERIWVIYWFHRNPRWRPKVLPPRSTTGRKGVLATRSPHRPNPLGLSAVRLLRVEGLRLHVQGADMIDGTPVLDIKPYVPYSDAFMESGSGWLERKDPLPGYIVEFADEAGTAVALDPGSGGPDLRDVRYRKSCNSARSRIPTGESARPQKAGAGHQGLATALHRRGTGDPCALGSNRITASRSWKRHRFCTVSFAANFGQATRTGRPTRRN